MATDVVCGVQLERVDQTHGGKTYKYTRVDNFAIGWLDETTSEEKENAQQDGIDIENGGQLAIENVQEEQIVQEEKETATEQKVSGEHLRNDKNVEFVPLNKVEESSRKALATAEDVEDEEKKKRSEIRLEDVSLPWEVRCRKIFSPMLRLHEEIISFSNFLKPTKEEKQMRISAIQKIEDVIHRIWPHARVELFGSFVTGLYLPTSDVDMVILDSGCEDIPKGLRLLANHVSKKLRAKNLAVLAKARVPIVKFEDADTNLNFDISFDIKGGPSAARYIIGKLDDITELRPLVMVLKIFLQNRELNEVYSGGIGSYTLITMVTVFLQTYRTHHAPREMDIPKDVYCYSQEKCLGILLIEFFNFFGNIFNYYDVGLTSRDGGFFYDKKDAGMYNYDRPYLMSIEDPQDRDSDIGKNSFNIQKVRSAFAYGYTLLTAPENHFGELLLMRILRLDAILIHRLDQWHAVGNNRKTTKERDPRERPSMYEKNLSESDKMEMMGVTSVSNDTGSDSSSSSMQESDDNRPYIPMVSKRKKARTR